MFDLPLDPQITLEDTIAFHQLLLASGAPINEINTLRKHFSAVKGGRLAMAAPEAAKVSLLVPDVPLRSLDALSSGPTSPDHSTVDEVRELLAKYDLNPKLPPPSAASLSAKICLSRPATRAGVRRFSRASASRSRACAPRDRGRFHERRRPGLSRFGLRDSAFQPRPGGECARDLAQKAGYLRAVDNSCDDWDYADAARYLLELFHTSARHAQAAVPDQRGRGDGDAQSHPRRGRAQPAICDGLRAGTGKYHGRTLTVFSAGSDGIDGNTQSAGAIADPTTVARATPSDFT
jgi:glycerate 2-kinase